MLDKEKNVKIIDFGFSTCIPNDKKIKIFCGTPSYMAPEIVNKTEYCGPPADIWALGVLLYAMLQGCFPFKGATDKDLYRRIGRGTFTPMDKVTIECQNMVQKILNVTPEARPSASDLLKDPWFDTKLPEKNNFMRTTGALDSKIRSFSNKPVAYPEDNKIHIKPIPTQTFSPKPRYPENSETPY